MQLHFNAFYVPATYSRTKVDNFNQSKGTSSRAHTTPLPCGSSVASKTHRVYSQIPYSCRVKWVTIYRDFILHVPTLIYNKSRRIYIYIAFVPR